MLELLKCQCLQSTREHIANTKPDSHLPTNTVSGSLSMKLWMDCYTSKVASKVSKYIINNTEIKIFPALTEKFWRFIL